jgi:hypothetical protein
MMTIDDLRRTWTQDTRAKLKAQGCPDGELERQTKDHMDTISDEYLVAAWQQAGRDITARKAAEAEKALADHQAAEVAKKAAAVTRRHTSELAEANKVAMTYQERAEAAERKAQGLEAQLDGLWKGQGRR